MSIHVENRQRFVPLRLSWLRRFASTALEHCRKLSDDNQYALRNLGEIEVAIVSDRVIAGVHKRFMQISGATDVLTFEHGEIVISAQTAARQAAEYGHGLDEEVALYIVHGLLHLNGYDDQNKGDASRMHRTQQRVLKACLSQVPCV